MTVVFVPNVDAEFELADPGHRRSERMAGHVQRLARALRPTLRQVFGADVFFAGVDAGTPPRGARGDAWCPTEHARAELVALGAEPPPAPPDEVLRAVNHRAFAASLGPLLPGAGFALSSSEVERLLSAAPEQRWMLKRPLGFSGRMRKVVVPSRLDRAAHTWIEASMEGYGRGLMVEPVVDRLLDVSLHGRVDAGGQLVERGQPVLVENAADGSFVCARRAVEGELDPGERDALEATFGRVAAALHASGYHGPFGIDAFRWRDERRTVRFHSLVELNARYTFGYWVGVHGVEAIRLGP